MPMYVCASGGTPFIAVLVAAGLSPGAALAFLLTGPATNATSWGVIGGLHGRRVAWAFVVTMVIVAVTCGMAVDLVFADFVPVALGEMGHDSHGWLACASAGVLAIVSASALLRRGPRGLLAEVFPRRTVGATEALDACGHGHGHHGHDHHGHDGQGHGHNDSGSEPGDDHSACCDHGCSR